MTPHLAAQLGAGLLLAALLCVLAGDPAMFARCIAVAVCCGVEAEAGLRA